MQFIVGKYFKVDPNRFYCIRGKKKDKDDGDVLWLDLYNIVNGVAVLVEREATYGYTPDAFSRYYETMEMQDKPFAPIKEVKQHIAAPKPPTQTIKADVKPVKKKKAPPPSTGGLF